MLRKFQNYAFVNLSQLSGFFLFALIKMLKAGNLWVLRTLLKVIFDVYVIRFMFITIAQLHSTRSELILGAVSNLADGCRMFTIVITSNNEWSRLKIRLTVLCWPTIPQNNSSSFSPLHSLFWFYCRVSTPEAATQRCS